MKKISINLLLVLLTAFVPLSLISGQEKKTEQKIKVVIADKEGTKTIIDTTYTDGSMPDSVVLENGRTVYFARGGNENSHFNVSEGGNIYVTCTVDDNGKESTEEKVIIVSGDKGKSTVAHSTGTTKHVYITTADNSENGEKAGKHVIITSAGSTDNDDTEMTKYVIAKDGVVVTVESNDEAKAKEVIKAVESKLDVKK